MRETIETLDMMIWLLTSSQSLLIYLSQLGSLAFPRLVALRCTTYFGNQASALSHTYPVVGVIP